MTSTARIRDIGILGAVAAALCLAFTACAPVLDWRDVRPAGSGVQLQFPCRPLSQQRQLALAGAPVTLVLHACAAGDQTWGLGVADTGDPARVGPALAELRASAAGNLSATPGRSAALLPPGATPQPGSVRTRLLGKLPDGQAMQMEVVVFAHGTQVYQASVLGRQLSDEGVETFIASIRFPP
jgi:hypothetical protein